MKKILTLTCSLMLVSFVFAQHNNRGWNNKRDKYERHDYPGSFETQRRNDVIARINHDYDKRIYWVHQSDMRYRDKKREIRRLEKERRDRIEMTYARFNDRNNRNYHHEHDNYVIH